MKFKFLIKISFFLLATILLTNCSKEEIIPEDIEINDFVWGGMNAYYKWQGNVEDLADTKFSNRNELNEYLGSFESPEDLFNSVLYQDTYSEITDDYTTFEDELEGYITTNGLEVRIVEYIDAATVTRNYAYAFSVTKDSDAEVQGISPGMIFTKANGATITAANFDVLFSNDNLTLTEANIPDSNTGIPVANGNFHTITANEIQENPISFDQTISVGSGTSEIGYFVYNHFGEDYINELNTVFATFKSDNIDDLIIDLRFNNGTGSTQTATYLGSMITGQFTDDVFSKQIWNDKVMSNINNENLATYFTDEIEYDNDTSENITSLGLDSVYFIISNETDGASLLLINSLVPYIDVHLIGYEGEQTGSNHLVSSILYDSDDYTKYGENFNTAHTWAIKPIVFEIQNKNNTNSANGYSPNLEVEEDFSSIAPLGDETETILAATIGYVTSTTSAKNTVSDNTTSSNKVNTSSATSSNMVFSF